MSFHFPTKNSQILLDFRPNPEEPSFKLPPILFVGKARKTRTTARINLLLNIYINNRLFKLLKGC